MALQVGQMAPDFTLKNHLEQDVRLSDYLGKKNVVIAFFPLAWTPIWTDQIPSYEDDLERFDGVSAQVLGISVDSVPSLKAWSDTLGGISYPLLSDFYPHGEVAQRYGVLRADGRSERAIFVIDRYGVIRYVDVHDIDLQPDNEVLFRVLAGVEGVEVPPRIEKNVEPGSEVVEKPEPAEMKVVMYCNAWCPACRRARGFFRSHGITFTEVDIGRDREAAERVRGWANGNETTPTFDVNGTIVLNFQRNKLMELLGIEE